MPSSSHAALLDAYDFPGALAAWRAEFNGREDSFDASWELAEIEERWGDSLFFSADSGSAGHYQAAQRALIPPGAMFSSSKENQRRMEAHGRLTNKLYAIAGDGKPRSPHENAQPHPSFKPMAHRQEIEPSQKPKTERREAVAEARKTKTKDQSELDRLHEGAQPHPSSEPIAPRQEIDLPPKSNAERREAVAEARKTRTKGQSELGRLYGSDQWAHYRLGGLWLEAATALAGNHQQLAQVACEWSYHHFEHYNKLWNAHLPASRFDSDGHEEMMEVGSLQNSLATLEESPAPGWVPPLLDGDWQAALAAIGTGAPTPEFQPLAAVLADACKTAGRDISF